MDYQLMMALQDFMPVLLSGVGLAVIAGMIGEMHSPARAMAWFGAGLVFLGGFAKASWKLIMALTLGYQNAVALDNALFLLMAPGFIFLTFALWYGQRRYYGARAADARRMWIAPVVLAAVTVITAFGVGTALYDPVRTGRQTWYFILLGVTTIMNIAIVVLAVWQCRREGVALGVLLFVFNIVTVLALQGIARGGASTSISLQWIAQGVNTMAQLAFVIAAVRIAAKMSMIRTGAPRSTGAPRTA
jgi:hypothetical protein